MVNEIFGAIMINAMEWVLAEGLCEYSMQHGMIVDLILGRGGHLLTVERTASESVHTLDVIAARIVRNGHHRVFSGGPILFISDPYRVRDWDRLESLFSEHEEIDGDRARGWVRVFTGEDGNIRSSLKIEACKETDPSELLHANLCG